MKIIFALLMSLSFAAWGLDYDPKFQNKHRYNKHETIPKLTKEQKAQRMEASETSKDPLKTTPNVRTTK